MKKAEIWGESRISASWRLTTTQFPTKIFWFWVGAKINITVNLRALNYFLAWLTPATTAGRGNTASQPQRLLHAWWRYRLRRDGRWHYWGKDLQWLIFLCACCVLSPLSSALFLEVVCTVKKNMNHKYLWKHSSKQLIWVCVIFISLILETIHK